MIPDNIHALKRKGKS